MSNDEIMKKQINYIKTSKKMRGEKQFIRRQIKILFDPLSASGRNFFFLRKKLEYIDYFDMFFYIITL